MSTLTALRNINDVVADLRAQQGEQERQTIERMRRDLEDRIRRIEMNRLVLPALTDIGEVDCPSWCDGSYINVNLGEHPAKRASQRARRGFARRLVMLRELLGSLKVSDKSPLHDNNRAVKVTLQSAEFPGVYVFYTEKIPRGSKAKCKIVKNTYYSLVCET